MKSRESGGGRLSNAAKAALAAKNAAAPEQEIVERLPDVITGQTMKEFKGAEHLGTEFDIPTDAYGAVLVAMVRDMTLMLSSGTPAAFRKLSFMRFLTAFIVMVVNLLLQCGLLYFIHFFVVQMSVKKAQTTYGNFLRQVFDDDGNLDRMAWLEYPDKKDMCQMAIQNKPFFVTVLSVWTLVMVGEFRDNFRFFRNVEAVPTVRRVEDQMVFTEQGSGGLGGECLCVGMTLCTRFLVYLVILLPKYMILITLLWEGSRWLATATSLCDTVMNAVALDFVLSIDEVLFTTLLPQGQQVQVEDTNFFIKEDPKAWPQIHALNWGQLKLSLGCVMFLGFWNFGYTWCIQDVLPWNLDFVAEMCSDYTLLQSAPVCDKMSAGRANEQCYPKGG